MHSTRSLRLALAAVGFLPVLSMVLHSARLVPLQYSALVLVIPCFLWTILSGLWFPQVGRLAFAGWCAGIMAVLFYDISRVPFMLNGWPDFIPRIGDWLLEKENSPAGIGYLWRYIGNGGGMGMSFFLISSLYSPTRNFIGTGVLFGLFIFVCLMLTLVTIPGAQDAMFRITPLSFTGSLIGHIVYGFVLGCVLRKRYRDHNSLRVVK